MSLLSQVNYVNLLLIDNPVGTGYSYVDHFSELAANNHQISMDLVSFTQQFMMTYPQFQKLPLYVFCESYGGKMTAEFALDLHRVRGARSVRGGRRVGDCRAHDVPAAVPTGAEGRPRPQQPEGHRPG